MCLSASNRGGKKQPQKHTSSASPEATSEALKQSDRELEHTKFLPEVKSIHAQGRELELSIVWGEGYAWC